MNPKEELIQAIERSPDEVVRALLELLRVWQRQRSPQAMQSEQKDVALQQTAHSSSSDYPLRGLPLVIADDFDQPMPELWEAMSQ